MTEERAYALIKQYNATQAKQPYRVLELATIIVCGLIRQGERVTESIIRSILDSLTGCLMMVVIHDWTKRDQLQLDNLDESLAQFQSYAVIQPSKLMELPDKSMVLYKNRHC